MSELLSKIKDVQQQDERLNELIKYIQGPFILDRKTLSGCLHVNDNGKCWTYYLQTKRNNRNFLRLSLDELRELKGFFASLDLPSEECKVNTEDTDD